MRADTHDGPEQRSSTLRPNTFVQDRLSIPILFLQRTVGPYIGFDIVAFDYGLDRSGALVVWEANPFPDLSYAENPIFPYKLPMADHVCRTLLTFHFERAGIPLPDR